MKKVISKILLFFTFVITIFVLLGVFIFLRYRAWEKEFIDDMNMEFLVDSESIKEISLDERIVKFTLSPSDTEFLELGTREFGSILFTTVDSYLQEDVYLKSMYIQPSNGKWEIFLNVGYKEVDLWTSFDVNKDSIQSAQLYTTAVYIGPFEISKYLDIVDIINKGIADSLVTLNENGFVGRYIENIELLENAIVLKGSRY